MAVGTRDQGLVGRSEEVARLGSTLEALEAGDAAPLAICGEPGIGKSRLLAELLERADDAGALTLSGRAAQMESDVPFAVFVEALDAYIDSEPRRIESLGRDHLVELARIFPSLGKLARPEDGVAQSERYHAHAAVRALLELLAGTGPLVLALDDLQWADEASLELTAYLLRRAPDTATLIAIAYRPDAPRLLSDALDEARHDPGLELLELSPLSRAEAVTMLPSELDDDAGSRLYRESGGNPFYLEQLRRSLEEHPPADDAPGDGGLGDEVPAAVAAALTREVGALSWGARRLLDGAAVAGDPFRVELAIAAAGLSDSRGLDALDELLEQRLVRPTEVPRRFAFRHPIVHKAIYSATAEGWRLGAHARVRDVLRSWRASATELAYHVEQAAVPGDADAIDVLDEAGRLAAPLAPALSARWLTAAMRLLPDDEVERRAEMLVRAATASAASGRLEEGRTGLIEALRLVPPDAWAARVALSSSLGSLSHMLGHHKEARTQLRATLNSLPEATSPEAAALQLELSVDRIYAADWDDAKSWAERAYAAADARGRSAMQVVADVLFCCGEMGTGRIAEAERHRARAALVNEQLDDRQLAERLEGPWGLGFCDFWMERYEDGVRHLDRGIALSRSTGRGALLAYLRIVKAWNLVRLGRAEEATSIAEEAVEASRLGRNFQSLAWALSIRCRIAEMLGDTEVALRAGEEAVAIGETRDESLVQTLARAHLGTAYVEAGDYDRGVEQMTLAGAPDFPDFFVNPKPLWCETLARAALGSGLDEEAERWVVRSEEFADGLDLPVAVASSLRARARLQLARGEAEPAAGLALDAAESEAGRGARIDAARTRILAGQALAGAHRPGLAVEQLELAYRELDACGAIRRRDEAARELRLLGQQMPRGGRRGHADAGVAALSERELEIAELVAAAKTNREIAEILFISEKTVEKHLSKVFAKLAIKGRAGVGAKLASTTEK
jgi:ATP/maltotriose-dependent transcriptional regulator MalT